MIAIIVLEAASGTEAVRVCQRILDPGLDYLEKPFTPEALARKVREVLDAAG